MKSLFIGNDHRVFSLFYLVSQSAVNIELSQIASVAHLKDLMKTKDIEQEIAVVILQYPQFGLNELKECLSYFSSPIPILFVTDENHLTQLHHNVAYSPLVTRVCYNADQMILEKTFQRLINLKKRNQKNNEPFLVFPTLFIDFEFKIQCDLYLKLSEDKIVKVFRKGSVVGPEDFDKYISKGAVESFHVKKSDYESISNSFFVRLQDKLAPENLKSENLLSCAKTVHKSLRSTIIQLGIKDEVLKVADATVGMIQAFSKKNPKVNSVLTKLMKKNDYFYEHSMMLTFVSTAIAKEVDWEPYVTAEKLAFASFFHDIGTEDEEIALMNFEKVEADEFGKKRIQDYKLHPSLAVEFMDSVSEIPSDAHRIVGMHHENQDGTGFPKGLDWKAIFPLAAVFIVAEDFVNCVYQGGVASWYVEDVLNDFDERYTKGNFKRAAKGLRKALGYIKDEDLEKTLKNVG